LLGLGAHLLWQMRIWDVHAPDSALRVFRSNRDCGLIVFAALMIAVVLG
jgi:4-hydroxybenzoate polyprenyltransferase